MPRPSTRGEPGRCARLQRQPVRRSAEEPAELRHRMHVGSLRRRREVADRHVLDHAAAKRAGLGHRKAPVWKRVSATQTFQSGAPPAKQSPCRAAASFNPRREPAPMRAGIRRPVVPRMRLAAAPQTGSLLMSKQDRHLVPCPLRNYRCPLVARGAARQWGYEVCQREQVGWISGSPDTRSSCRNPNSLPRTIINENSPIGLPTKTPEVNRSGECRPGENGIPTFRQRRSA